MILKSPSSQSQKKRAFFAKLPKTPKPGGAESQNPHSRLLFRQPILARPPLRASRGRAEGPGITAYPPKRVGLLSVNFLGRLQLRFSSETTGSRPSGRKIKYTIGQRIAKMEKAVNFGQTTHTVFFTPIESSYNAIALSRDSRHAGCNGWHGGPAGVTALGQNQIFLRSKKSSKATPRSIRRATSAEYV